MASGLGGVMAAEYILAVDYGAKRVGVAVAHVVARFPNPLTTLPNDDNLLPALADVVAREKAGLVLVGLPRGMDGGYTEQTRTAEAFAQQLQNTVTVPVELVDETLTSVDAEDTLGNKIHTKADIDALAAANILERYLVEHPAGEVKL